MMSVDFFLPEQARRSINAPRTLLGKALPCPVSPDTPCHDDEDIRSEVVRLTESRPSGIYRKDLTFLLEWLESEGLWYIWLEGKDVRRAYFPGSGGTLDSLSSISQSWNTSVMGLHYS